MQLRLLQLFVILGSLFAISMAGLSDNQILELSKSSKNHIIDITDDNYEKILYGKRDYHLILVMTSDSVQINCLLCREFKPDYDIIVNSWFQDHPNGLPEHELNEVYEKSKITKKNIYFARAEFANARKLFQIFELQSIPKLYHFPPTNMPGRHDLLSDSNEYPFFHGDQKVLVTDFLNSKTGHKYNLYIPVNYSAVIFNIVITLSILVILYVFRGLVLKFVSNKYAWLIVSGGLTLVFISGYMFNQIRQTPYIRQGEGALQYFVPGQQNQLGIETQIVGFVYLFLSVLFVLLTVHSPTYKNALVNLIAVSIFSILIFVFYSLLLSIFSLKGLGYPYSFIRFF
ncbi:uncharacterized protein RJT21DRAFT_114420 [Scheffersomyces amazonensis]|uniref:uncharacterized protein n=1 Tax=Scheffersomyces amazonensis TaxID=1078765 RepID=UPI00315D2EEE